MLGPGGGSGPGAPALPDILRSSLVSVAPSFNINNLGAVAGGDLGGCRALSLECRPPRGGGGKTRLRGHLRCTTRPARRQLCRHRRRRRRRRRRHARCRCRRRGRHLLHALLLLLLPGRLPGRQDGRAGSPGCGRLIRWVVWGGGSLGGRRRPFSNHGPQKMRKGGQSAPCSRGVDCRPQMRRGAPLITP